MQINRVVFVLLCSLFSLGVNRAWSQATTSLSGNVTDSKGALVSGANVKLTLTATGSQRTGVTNASGEYQFPQLAPGRYALEVASVGFATVKKTGIDLLVDQPARLNVTLPVASVTSQVEVTANVEPVLNTTDASLGNVFTPRQIEELPSEERNVPALLSLQPGVTYLGPGNGNSVNDSRSGAINGARADQSNVTLDGIDVNDINNGFAFTSVLRVSQDAVSEFRVTTTNPTATEGRSSGAQVALVTKSGSNALHGSVYEYNRSNLFEANDFFNKQLEEAQGQSNRPLQLVYNVFGAAVGGPLKHDKAFFFLNYEGERESIGGVSNHNLVPTPSFRAGNLYYACTDPSQCSITNPSTPGITYNLLTPSDIQSMDPQNIGVSPAMLTLLNQYPAPNNPLVGDGLNTEGYSFSYTTKPSLNNYTARFDLNLSPKQTLFWRGSLLGDKQPDGPLFPGQPPATVGENTSKGFALGYTYLLRNNLVNTLNFGLTRQSLTTAGQLSQPYVSFIFTGPQAVTPTSSVTIPLYNLVDNLSWTKGRHTLAFGTDIRFIDDRGSSNALSYSNAAGVPGYLPGSVAGSGGAFDPAAYGFPDVAPPFRSNYNSSILDIAGILTVGNVTYNTTKTGSALPVGAPVVRDYRWNEYEFFAQDTWRVTRDLTLLYGLRYTYQQTPAETSGTQVGVCQVQTGACASGPFSLTQFVNTSGQLAASSQAANGAGELGFPLNGRYNGKPDYWSPDKADFSPRVAVAFSPSADSGFLNKLFGNGRTSIRGGYSLIYDHFGAGIVNTFDTEGSYGLATTLSTSPGTFSADTAPRFTSLHSIPQVLLPPAPVIGFPGIPVSSGPTSAAIYWSQDSAVKTPYAHAVDFSISRQIRNNSSLEVAYVGRFARRLLEQDDVSMPTNLAAAGTTYFAAAKQLSLLAAAGTPVSAVPQIPYWETLFGALAGQNGLTATQNIYRYFNRFEFNETQALYDIDLPASITGVPINRGQLYPSYRFYHDQFSSLYAWRSIGHSNYNGLEVIYRHRFGLGLQADFNYTYSKSLDLTSQAERLGVAGVDNGGQIFNTWFPDQLYGDSDFDIRHQINANYIWDLPIGRGKRYVSGIGHAADQLIGGWQLTGIVRWTSGLPVSVVNGANWPTNWNIAGYATEVAPLPAKGHAPGQPLQQMFEDPTAAYNAFAHTFPGDSGTRNPIRGNGYFGWDAGLGKSVALTERTKLKIGMEVFNVTNSVRFDPHGISLNLDNPGTFGIANTTLTTYRRAQFYGRFEF